MTAAAERHWLYDHCESDRNGPHPKYGAWLHRPWVLKDAAGRDWTLAPSLACIVSLLGRHAGAQDATEGFATALARVWKPPPPGEAFVWRELRGFLGPVPPYPVCPECGGDGKWRPDPEELAWAEHDEVELVPGDHCDLCGGSGVSPVLPTRPVLLCGVCVNANLLAHALDAADAAFGNVTDQDDLAEVCVRKKGGLFPEPDPAGLLTVRSVTPLWRVDVMPLTGDDYGDVTGRFPPGANP